MEGSGEAGTCRFGVSGDPYSYDHARGGQRDAGEVNQFKAIHIQPDFVIANFYLGLVYLELNDRDSALKEYDILKKMGRKNVDRDYENDLFDRIE